MRKFIVEGNEIQIAEKHVKKYFSIGKCFIQSGEVLIPVEGNIYLSEDGTLCDCDQCSNELGELVDQDGLPLSKTIDFSSMEPVKGFIYNDKLQIIDQLQEVV